MPEMIYNLDFARCVFCWFQKLGEKLTEEQKVIDDLRTTASKLTPSLSRLEQDLVQNQLR